jgi:hypothetical protein
MLLEPNGWWRCCLVGALLATQQSLKEEVGMHSRPSVVLLAVLAATAQSVRAQEGGTAGAVSGAAASASSIPSFSGTWGHNGFPGLEPPASGAGPVVNKSRRPQSFDDNGRPYARGKAPLVSHNAQLVGDYSNPILKPQAAERVKQQGDIELSGHPAPNPSNQCRPNPMPYILWNLGFQILQQPDKVTFVYIFNHEFRQVRLNQSHPAPLTPSWHGDAVGHYEGDTLVVDTIGTKVGPFSMVDHYGTPFSEAMHVIERYRLIDYDTAKEALARDAKENFRFNPAGNDHSVIIDPNYRGKYLQLQLTVEDVGTFTMPWSATVTYRPAISSSSATIAEYVCAENPNELTRHAAIPVANKPDF